MRTNGWYRFDQWRASISQEGTVVNTGARNCGCSAWLSQIPLYLTRHLLDVRIDVLAGPFQMMFPTCPPSRKSLASPRMVVKDKIKRMEMRMMWEQGRGN